MSVAVGRLQQEAQCAGEKTVCPSSLKGMVRLQVEGWEIRSEAKQQSQTLLYRRNIFWSKTYEQQEMLKFNGVWYAWYWPSEELMTR